MHAINHFELNATQILEPEVTERNLRENENHGIENIESNEDQVSESVPSDDLPPKTESTSDNFYDQMPEASSTYSFPLNLMHHPLHKFW